MSKIRIATIQMNAAPAPRDERLRRAAALVEGATREGAELVLLPELFDSGYEYSDENYRRATGMDGETVLWLRGTAARLGVHLAGSFLRRDGDRIFNTLLLAAPDGRAWTYDKNFPWMWERAYFEPGRGVTVAETALGRVGMMVCWDVAHRRLWRQYAGRVDLVLVSACPPRPFDFRLVLPDGRRVENDLPGALVRGMRASAEETFGAHLRRQAAYIGAPVAVAGSTGMFNSRLPNQVLSLAALALLYPRLLRYRRQFGQARIETGYYDETYIASASGEVLARAPGGLETLVTAELTLPDLLPQVQGNPPPYGISGLSYLIDGLSNRLWAGAYERGKLAGR